jgi:hypothetical protein
MPDQRRQCPPLHDEADPGHHRSTHHEPKQRIDPGPLQPLVTEEHTEDQELAVGEVDDPQHTEHERKSERCEGIQPAEQQPWSSARSAATAVGRYILLAGQR